MVSLSGAFSGISQTHLGETCILSSMGGLCGSAAIFEANCYSVYLDTGYISSLVHLEPDRLKLRLLNARNTTVLCNPGQANTLLLRPQFGGVDNLKW